LRDCSTEKRTDEDLSYHAASKGARKRAGRTGPDSETMEAERVMTACRLITKSIEAYL
jgi:hypothetical protein